MAQPSELSEEFGEDGAAEHAPGTSAMSCSTQEKAIIVTISIIIINIFVIILITIRSHLGSSAARAAVPRGTP